MTLRKTHNCLPYILGCVLTVLLQACGGGGGGAAAPAINLPPVASAGSAQNAVQQTMIVVSGVASSDPEGAALSYSWAFTTSPSGNNVTLNNANAVTANFTPSLQGNYVLRLTVTDPAGLSASATVTITVAANTAPVANAGAAQIVYLGNIVTLSGANSSDANGHALSYAWILSTRPSGSLASLAGANTVSPTLIPDVVGTYVAQLFVTDSLGAASSVSTVSITANNASTVINNAFTTACTGVNCAATSATQYGGNGTGIWRYNNTSTSVATVNIDIAGVSAGKTVTLAFTNPEVSNATSLPTLGINVSSNLKPSSPSASQSQFKTDQHGHSYNQIQIHSVRKVFSKPAHDDVHQIMLKRNQAVALMQKSSPKLSRAEMQIRQTQWDAKPKVHASPVVGTSKTWIDYFDNNVPQGVSYATTNQHVCSLGGSRNAVFWKQSNDPTLTPAILAKFTNAACGTTGGFAKLINLVGDPWGSHASFYAITESATNKRDVNVVFVNDATAPWAGYFWGGNNYLNSLWPSNEALVFFVNVKSLVGNEDYFISTLIHEARHMINFYQNDVVRGKTTDTWLEETSAMMSEDIIAPTVIPSGINKITAYDNGGRLGSYLYYGGALSLDKWEDNSYSYDMGGALAAFLNRQYGVTLTQQLITGCTTGTAMTNSYTCLNNLIQANGGVSLGEDLSRMGATVFSKMPAANSPLGYGYKAKLTGGYSLGAVDLSNPSYEIGYTPLLSTYKSTSHFYDQSIVSAGITRFKRNGVKVPAGTVLQVVIQ